MAPPKTMALSQQSSLNTVGQQQAGDMKQNTVKARKRKGKQQQQHQPSEHNADHVHQKSAVEQPSLMNTNNRQNVESTSSSFKTEVTDLQTSKKQTQTNSLAANNPVIKPIERTTLNKGQSNIKQQAKESLPTKKRQEPANGVRRVVQATTETPVVGKHKQLVNEEADDIDAGIELDGSSNSGSSVKDIGEDQKSASVSPVMSQATTSIAAEGFESTGSSNVNKQTAEVTHIEKVNGSECTPAKLLTIDEPLEVKKSSSSATKQQLAANQQVIDADEQQLQQKLQNKQKKLVSQDSGASLDDNSMVENDNFGLKKTQVTTDVAIQAKSDKTTAAAAASSNTTTTSKVKPRKFSSQSSQESADASSCKVCGQHVYQMEKMLAEKSIYHKRCFRCYQCKIQLRVDNYSSHEGQVYCKAHHRQIFQPQVKLDNGDDVDIVAKSTTKPVDDYLLHRGRLSELSFSFLQPKPQELLKRQMIICENEPAELPKDVVRSDAKLDDGIDHLNLNLNNILEKFERGTASGGEESQPSSAGMVIDKPSFNIRKTLMAFESKSHDNTEERNERATEKPVVKKLTNLNGFLNRQNSQENDQVSAPSRPVAVKRSESLMLRLKKYESRIAGEQVDDDEDQDKNGDEDDDENNNSGEPKQKSTNNKLKINSLNLSSLKNQWENGEISKKKRSDGDDHDNDDVSGGEDCRSAAGDKINGPVFQKSGEKSEELIRIRQQLARKKSGDSASVKNIYENAIKEAQLQQQASRRESSDLSALNGFSTTDIQQKLLQRTEQSTTPNKDHFQLNLSNRANKLKERFELGLINNSSRDDSDQSDGDEPPISKLEQIRQEKLEDLSIFTEGEIKAREARSMFQQIDRRISAANGGGRQPVVSSRSLAFVQDAMRNKLTNRMTAKSNHAIQQQNNHHQPQQDQQQQPLENRPIRLTNNVRI